MNVIEAMELLVQLPDDTPILIREHDSGGPVLFRDAVIVTLKVAAKRPGAEYYPRFINLPERNTLTAVVLE